MTGYRFFLILCGIYLNLFMLLAFYLLSDEESKSVGILLYLTFGFSLPLIFVCYNWNKNSE